MRFVPAFLGLTVALGTLQSQAPATTAAATAAGRNLADAMDRVLAGAGSEAAERTICLVLDAGPNLAQAGFASQFEAALQRHQPALRRTRMALAVVGHKGSVLQTATLDHSKIAQLVRAQLDQPSAAMKNVYADVRAALSVFSGGGGERLVWLATLDNGDLEDDVDQTVKELQKAQARCLVLTSEATLADSYWAGRPAQDKPRGGLLTGSDGAVIDLPWGFLFQIRPANEATPAGVAMWGLSRLASGSNGRVSLYASAAQVAHQCNFHQRCLFCTGDHQPPADDWSQPQVAELAPFAGSRQETYATLGADPAFRAMVEAWRAAAEAGLVRSQPPFRITGTTATADRARDGRNLDLFGSAQFEQKAKRAEEAAQKAAQIGAALEAQIGKLDATRCAPRQLAAARYTRVLLQLTRVNLLGFAGYCREIAPRQLAQDGKDLPAPEVPAVEREDRPAGIGYGNYCLCHGVEPFFEVELPGGAVFRQELQALAGMYADYQALYARSQFGFALRRNGIAWFWPTYPGNPQELARNRPKSANDNQPPTTPDRPHRPSAGGSSGGSAGPSTGGGR